MRSPHDAQRQHPSFQRVKEALKDPLLEAKLSFFSHIAGCVEPFLKRRRILEAARQEAGKITKQLAELQK